MRGGLRVGGLSLVYNLPKSGFHTQMQQPVQPCVYCLAPPVPGAPAAVHRSPQALPGAHSPGTARFPAGSCSEERFAALVLQGTRQASTQMQTCVGSEAMERGLENVASFLGIGIETQYSSAQLG